MVIILLMYGAIEARLYICLNFVLDRIRILFFITADFSIGAFMFVLIFYLCDAVKLDTKIILKVIVIFFGIHADGRFFDSHGVHLVIGKACIVSKMYDHEQLISRCHAAGLRAVRSYGAVPLSITLRTLWRSFGIGALMYVLIYYICNAVKLGIKAIQKDIAKECDQKNLAKICDHQLLDL